MTNTIPNVPRELLERCAQYTPTLEKQEDRARALSELRALLSAPSPTSCGHAACKSLGEPHPFCKFVSALDAAPAVCKWTYNEDDCFYSTQCGSHWHYSEGGTPDEHGQLFCHACGKQVDDTRGEDCE